LDGALRTVVYEHAIAQLISSEDSLPTTEIGESDFSYFAKIQSRNFDFS